MTGVSQDGLVFLEIGSGEQKWLINIAAITRIIDLDESTADDVKLPGIGINMIGSDGLLRIGNYTTDRVKKDIVKAIRDHYDNLVEKELLS